MRQTGNGRLPRDVGALWRTSHALGQLLRVCDARRAGSAKLGPVSARRLQKPERRWLMESRALAEYTSHRRPVRLCQNDRYMPKLFLLTLLRGDLLCRRKRSRSLRGKGISKTRWRRDTRTGVPTRDRERRGRRQYTIQRVLNSFSAAVSVIVCAGKQVAASNVRRNSFGI